MGLNIMQIFQKFLQIYLLKNIILRKNNPYSIFLMKIRSLFKICMRTQKSTKISLQFDSKTITQSNKFAISKKKTKLPLTSHDHIKVYELISQWRKNHTAPVDIVGCDVLADQNATKQVQKYQTLIALVLSVQTKDQITGMIVKRLIQYGLQPKIMAGLSQQQILNLIKESNFNKRKSKNIKEISKIIVQKGLPKNKQQLLQYPGVGQKIAMIYMRSAEGKNQGIGVDTHVHRITNRLGWVATNNPNQTEEQLQSLFPSKYWKTINVNLVGFGQTLCEAKKPKCNQCPVKDLCPSANLCF